MSNILLFYEHLAFLSTCPFPKISGSVRLMSRVLIEPINFTDGSTVLQHALRRRFYSPCLNSLLDICHNGHSLILTCNLLLAAIYFHLICTRVQRLTLTNFLQSGQASGGCTTEAGYICNSSALITSCPEYWFHPSFFLHI